MKKAVASLTMSLAFIVGCSTAEVSDVSKSESNDVSASVAQKTVNNSAVSSYFVTDYFKVAVPETWKVVSYDGPEIPTYVSLKRKDSSALITIRIVKSDKDVEELCQDVAKKFEAQSRDIVLGPEVYYGTCTISADENSDNATLWLRKYDDDKSVYSIYFEGDVDHVNEVLSTLEGNEKMMNLLVMPLKQNL